MAASIKELMGENWQLQQQLNSLKKLPQDKRGPRQRKVEVECKPVTCPNYKQEVCTSQTTVLIFKKCGTVPSRMDEAIVIVWISKQFS